MRDKLYTSLGIAALLATCWIQTGCGGASAQEVEQPVRTAADDAMDISNLQGRYLHALNANQFDLIPSFFAQRDPTVSIKLPTGSTLTGLAAVTAEFATLKAMATNHGGFIGTHLATTPVIKVNADGRTAQGSWMSTGLTVFGPAFGNTTPPYRTAPTIGRYAHDFVKEDGVWKFKSFSWTIFVSLPAYQFDPATAGPGWANTPMTPGSKATPWPPSPFDQ